MKLFLTTLLLLTTLHLHAQETFSNEKQSAQKAVTDFFQSLADRDPEKLKLYCTPDVLILESGSVWNLDTLVQKISKITAPNFKRVNSIEFLDTNITSEVAWISFYNMAEITLNEKQISVKWLETAILVKEKGQWKLRTLHSTTLKRS